MATVTELALFQQSLRIKALERAVKELKEIAVTEMDATGFGKWHHVCKQAVDRADLALGFEPVGEEYQQPF